LSFFYEHREQRKQTEHPTKKKTANCFSHASHTRLVEKTVCRLKSRIDCQKLQKKVKNGRSNLPPHLEKEISETGGWGGKNHEGGKSSEPAKNRNTPKNFSLKVKTTREMGIEWYNFFDGVS